MQMMQMQFISVKVIEKIKTCCTEKETFFLLFIYDTPISSVRK